VIRVEEQDALPHEAMVPDETHAAELVALLAPVESHVAELVGPLAQDESHVAELVGFPAQDGSRAALTLVPARRETQAGVAVLDAAPGVAQLDVFPVQVAAQSAAVQ